MRGWVIVGALAVAATWACATVAGNSSATTRYFAARQDNVEYIGPEAERRPTRAERITEVTGYWKLFLQAYRAVEDDPALREKLAADPPHLESGRAREQIRGLGVTDAAIDAQGTMVYTLQLAALTRSANLRQFLRRVQGPTDHGCFEGTGIYRQVAKGFGLGYGDDSIEYKDDPVYIESSGRFTQVRYGLYASAEDTARDASVWQSRYSVTPWVISVPLSEALVGNVLWGALPGVYTPPT